jgi:hypothetical protein
LRPKKSNSEVANLAASLAAKVQGIDASIGRISEIFWDEERAAIGAVLALRQSGSIKVLRPVSHGGLICGLFKILGPMWTLSPRLRCYDTFGAGLLTEGGARYLTILEQDKIQVAKNICDEFAMNLVEAADVLFDGAGVICVGPLTINIKELCSAYFKSQMF